MTVVVGLVHKDAVWLGADAGAVAGWTLETRAPSSKLVRIGDMLIGCTSSFRMIDLLRYRVAPPPEDVPDLHRYLATEWIDEVRRVFAEGGFRKKDNEVETGGDFLIAWRGRLFDVGSDFQVGESAAGYAVVGSGDATALGALHVLHRLSINPDEKVRQALEAAEAHNIGVRGPFEVWSAA